MKIYLALLSSLFLPLVALAVDVTAEITLVLPSTGESYSLNNGSAFDTLTINNDNFEFAVSSGQTVVLRSGNKRNLSNNQNASVTCGSDESSINITFTSTVTFIVTPSGTCSPSGGGGGGGGGGGTVAAPAPSPAPAATPAIPATTTPAITTPPAPAPIPPPPTPPPAPAIVFSRDLVFGMSGNDITQLQSLLASDKSIYPEGLITGYFGSLTRAAVRRFQAKYVLPQVGRVGPLTRAKLSEVFGGVSMPAPTPSLLKGKKITLTLYKGTLHEEVKILQEFLAKDKEVYPEGLITGYFGKLTEAAVKRFQEKYGIEPVGIVGPKTRAKINE